jgi:hypothetical protein
MKRGKRKSKIIRKLGKEGNIKRKGNTREKEESQT